MIQKIIDKFGKSILRRSALNLPNGPEDIQFFMMKKPIRCAVEIGTFRGLSSAWISQFCEKLITIDLLDGQAEHELWKDKPKRNDIWDYLGIKNIYFQPVKCNNSKQRLLKDMDFDFAFIDGDHSYEGVQVDFELTKKCGRVLFHDFDEATGKECPVRDFILDIKKLYGGELETTKDFAYWTSK